jgi:hypothetical protein
MLTPPPLVSNTPSNTPYLVAVVIMALIAVIGVLGTMFFRPGVDNTAIITLILGFTATTTGSILAFMKSQETHLMVNSKLERWMSDHVDLAATNARAEGTIAGIAQEQARSLATPSAPSSTTPMVAVDLPKHMPESK